MRVCVCVCVACVWGEAFVCGGEACVCVCVFYDMCVTAREYLQKLFVDSLLKRATGKTSIPHRRAELSADVIDNYLIVYRRHMIVMFFPHRCWDGR